MKKFILILLFCNCAIADDACTPFGYELSNISVSSLTSVSSNGCVDGFLFSTPFAFILTDDTYCSAGYYFNGTSCVALDTGDGCPTNYYTSSSFVRINTNGTCSSGGVFETDVPICAVKIGDTSASFCTPQLECGSGSMTLRSSTGMNLPIWRDKLTIPSLGIGFENGDVCYINLISGAQSNTINIKYNNQIFHGGE